MSSIRRALAIFAKHPSSGQVKTRLKPKLSASKVAKLYECFLEDTLELVLKYKFLKLFLYVWPENLLSEFNKYITENITTLPQEGSNLGERLFNSTNSLFEEGFNQVGVISVDSPNIPNYIVPAAYQLLDDNDIVIGPADDGGYYLIALKRASPKLFQGIDWSTEKVFSQTVIKAVGGGFDVGLLPEWYDVDTYKDLLKLKRDLEEQKKVAQNIPQRTLKFIRENVN